MPDAFAGRRMVLSATLLGVQGLRQRDGIVAHVVAQRLMDLNHLLDRDGLNAPLTRAGYVKNNSHDPRDAGGRSGGPRSRVIGLEFSSRDTRPVA